MQKRPPSIAQIAVMVTFALSCFGLLTFLWKSFGGPSPLAPKAYRLTADFGEATQLSETAAVRISGIQVGRVVRARLDGDRTRVTMEIEPRYAPIPRDSRAILRQKTLLGETYVELTPGRKGAGALPDGGRLATANVLPTTELDEVTRALDPRTRRALRRAVVALGELGVDAEDLNHALGNLPAFTGGIGDLLRSLDRQHVAVRTLVHDLGGILTALGQRQGELTGLVRAGDAVLATTARRDRDLAEAVRILPTTLAELRPTLALVRGVTRDASPLVRALRPGVHVLRPALDDAAALAPRAEALFGDVDRLVDVSRAGLPATTRIVRSAHDLFQLLPPTLREAQPVVDYLGLYKEDAVQQLAGLSAAMQGSAPGRLGGEPLHYLRALVPLTAEGAVVAERRFGTNRHNPYPRPGWLSGLEHGLEAYDCQNVGNPGSADPAPECKVQPPIEFQGRRTAFPHLERAR
ncbi:MAG TPA: MlaD family protein [Thermoleophilaceae bacterium]